MAVILLVQYWLVPFAARHAQTACLSRLQQRCNVISNMQVWDNPVTEKPALEPCFAAAFHGIELCFLLLSHFISDDRKYVFRRPRIELVAHDIQQQCLLLTEVSLLLCRRP